MSEVKVNKISPRTNCGTVTLGDSGDTFTIPAGVSITNSGTASGFGATGAVSWNTTVKTSGFTAVAGEGYFVNTTGGAVSVNLPAGTAGAVVGFKDYANTFDTNAVTLVQNGSDKIGGSTENALLSTEGQAVTLVFVDSTQGWLVTDSGLQSEAPVPTFISATGGTITTDGNFKIHTFTGPGTFTVCSVGNPVGSNEVSYMVVAGGGGTANNEGSGGGGAGGFREGKTPQCTYTASPLACTSGSNNGLPVTAQGYPITVGSGGTAGVGNPQQCGATTAATNGSNSVFSTITSTGGGFGGRGNSPNNSPATPNLIGNPGGSGGGAGGRAQCTPSPGPAASGGTGNTPPVSPSQGNPGGSGMLTTTPTNDRGGGGGGATAAGTASPGVSPAPAGNGGAGATTSINGTPTAFAGGGGGGGYSGGDSEGGGGTGGTGGGGNGGSTPGSPAGTTGDAGTANTGGGGGGGSSGPSGPNPSSGSTGGSGIVIIRYKFQ